VTFEWIGQFSQNFVKEGTTGYLTSQTLHLLPSTILICWLFKT